MVLSHPPVASRRQVPSYKYYTRLLSRAALHFNISPSSGRGNSALSAAPNLTQSSPAPLIYAQHICTYTAHLHLQLQRIFVLLLMVQQRREREVSGHVAHLVIGERGRAREFATRKRSVALACARAFTCACVCICASV